MGKERWDDVKAEAVRDFFSKENMDEIRKFDPDIITGDQPYAGLLSGRLSMGTKKVDVTTIPSPDIDLDYYGGKRVLVVSSDPLDGELPRQVIKKFGNYIQNLGGFRYAVGDPVKLFTFDELESEYGNRLSDE